jgi:hypothetical protein
VTTPIEPIRPRVTPTVPTRRVERTSRDPQREQSGRQDPRDDPADGDAQDGEEPGLHVDVLA